MKFASLQGKETTPFVAVVDPVAGRYWPLPELIPGFNGDMSDLIRGWESYQPQLSPTGPGQELGAARVLAPLRPARNVFCVGKNYRDHVAEIARAGLDNTGRSPDAEATFPVVFTKTPDSIIGHLAGIPAHADITRMLDYEAELAVIIGRGGTGIRREDALGHIWGYTIVNDVSARDRQKNHSQWFLGKSLDGFCPMGPWIVTADAFNPAAADIRCWVNDELRQDANTSQFIFDIPRLIETISAGIALKPGDVISTGTPAGVGAGFQPPRFLKVGDQVRIEIEGIGRLQNPVVEH